MDGYKLADSSRSGFAQHPLTIHAAAQVIDPVERASHFRGCPKRWSRFLRQVVKVGPMTRRMIHHEDAQTVYVSIRFQQRPPFGVRPEGGHFQAAVLSVCRM